jgi:hypothetical protein
MSQTLDNMDNPAFTDDVIPFQFREKTDKQGTLEWLKAWFDFEYERAYPRYIMYRRYINFYKNLEEYENDGMMRTSTRNTGSVRKKPKVRDNIVYEYTEHRVAQVSKKKVALTFIPRVQNSQDDINAAKAAKLLIRARHEDRGFDADMIRMDRTTFLLGHSLYQMSWDKDCGGYAPSYERKKNELMEGKTALVDEATGKPIDLATLQKKAKLGDTKGRLWQPYQWFPEPHKYKTSDCDYLNTFEWMAKQYVEKKWKLQKDTLKNAEHPKWDFSSDKLDRPNNQVLVHTFWHKPTEFFPEGCKIVWCDDVILEWTDWPCPFDHLPFEEDKDIEIENEYWGRPFVTNIEQFYKVNNSLISGMARNHGVLNAPKVLAPEGSIDAKSWNNEYGLVQYRGAMKPEVLQHQYVNRGEIEFQQYCQDRSGKLSGVFDISKGEVPPGITAASAIRYLDEQEHQRANPSISKRKKRILNVTRMEYLLMAQNYKETDERTIRLVGENNEYIIKSFKKLALNSIADVREENTSALSDTKSGAIADIIDLNSVTQNDPAFGPKEIHKILCMGLDEQFKDETSYAVDTARTVLEMILNTEQVPPPEATDGLLEHYGVFSRFVESLVFKTKLDETRKAAIMDYIGALEMLMWQKKNQNPKFAMLMMEYSKFPMVFSPPEPPMPVSPDPAMGGQPPVSGAPAADGMEFQKKQIDQQLKTEQGV